MAADAVSAPLTARQRLTLQLQLRWGPMTAWQVATITGTPLVDTAVVS